MINGKKVLAIIPARGGSKGISRKNIQPLMGKPLIAWTIGEAIKSVYLDKIIVSSDDDEIIEVSKKWGAEVPFKRPYELAQDDTPGIAPVIHAVEQFPGYDYIVLLQPTSPLRIVKDIDKALEKCVEQNAVSTVSVVKSSSSPYWMYNIDENGYLKSFLQIENDFFPYQRQKAPVTFELNGAVYVSTVLSLKRNKSFLLEDTVSYEMPRERSIDIDTIEDLKFCEFLLSNR